MRRSIYSLVIGIIFAGVALLLLFNSRAPAKEAEADVPTIATTPLMVVANDIPYGERITPELVQIVQWPTASIPKDAVLTRAELFEGPEAPRIALRSMAAGEPFLKQRLSGFGERPILSRKVAEGMRAFTVRINDVSGVGGFILPGDHVDIMLTHEVDGRMATDVLLQNINVLGIDQMSNESADDPVLGRSATFEVTPEQAQKLALASQVGELSLMLRNYATLADEKTAQIAADDLGERKAAPPPRVRPAPPKDSSVYVNVRKGTEVEAEKVAH